MAEADAKAGRDRLVGGVAALLLAVIVIAGLVAVLSKDDSEGSGDAASATEPAVDNSAAVREWLVGFCGPFAAVEAVVADRAALVANPPTDAPAVKQAYVDIFTRTTDALTAMADRFTAIGEPPVDDAAPGYMAANVELLRAAVDLSAQRRDRAIALDPADIPAVNAFSAELAGAPDPVAEAFPTINELDSATVDAQIVEVSECDLVVNRPEPAPAPEQAPEPAPAPAPGGP